MQIINTMGANLRPVVIGLAKQQAEILKRTISFRPFQRPLAFATSATQDDLIIAIIQLKQNPAFDRIIFVDGNEFRLTGAVNEVLGDGSLNPTVTWKGGIPPFIVELQYNNPNQGGFMDSDTTGMVVNINPALTDGTGDIVTAEMAREYIISKIDDADGWWADDLQTVDLGLDEEENIQKRQNAIGLSITDSSPDPRKLFVPFAPDPAYEADGITPTGIFSKYPEARFGPPTWCVPVLHWAQPAAIVYGAALQVGQQLAAEVHIPGTSTPLPGVLDYWLDSGYTVPAANVVPDANTGLPLYATFQADDGLHYHLAEAEQGIVVDKAAQTITEISLYGNNDAFFIGTNPPHGAYRMAGDKALVLIRHSRNSGDTAADQALLDAISAGTPVAPPSGNPFVFMPSGVIAVLNTGWGTYNGMYAYFATVQITGAGIYSLAVSLAGNNNWTGSSASTAQLKAMLGMNVPGGVTFDINDPATITYGEALDVLCWSPIAGDPAYQTAGEPAGWIVDPVPGSYLETNSDGTPHSYSITALFYPLDADNYPSPMEYEQWLTVSKNVPVVIWETANSYVYGTQWKHICTALLRNSHHLTDESWDVPMTTRTYTVDGYANPVKNGPITDMDGYPDADDVFLTVEIIPGDFPGGNYALPNPAVTGAYDHGFTITPKPIQVVANNYSKTYSANEPPLLFSVTGLLGSDQTTGALTRDAGENVGVYTIRQGSVAASGNYTIQFTPGTLTVNKANQVLGDIVSTYTAGAGNPPIAGRQAMPGDTAVISITSSGASGNPVTYTSSNTAVCTVSGNTLAIVGVGTAYLTAHQAGNSNYNAAADKDSSPINTIAAPVAPTITFGTVPSLTVDGTFQITATSNSAAPITFTLQNDVSHNGDISSSGMLVCNHAGTNNLTIRASQAAYGLTYTAGIADRVVSIGKGQAYAEWEDDLGNIDYGTNLVGKLNAKAKRPNGIEFGEMEVTWTYYEINPETSVTIGVITEATVLNHFPHMPTGNVLKASFTVDNTDDYYSTGDTVPPCATNQIYINQVDQTISDYSLSSVVTYEGYELFEYLPAEPTASSGLPVTLESLTPTICIIGTDFYDGMVLGTNNGTCIIAATQSGDDNTTAAAPVVRSAQVTAAGLPPAVVAMTISGWQASSISWINGGGPFTIAFYGTGSVSNVSWSHQYSMDRYVSVHPTNPALPWYADSGGIRITDTNLGTVIDVPYSSMVNGPLPYVAPPVVKSWVQIYASGCGIPSSLQYLAGGYLVNGTIRRTWQDYAVTWGYSTDTPSEGHSFSVIRAATGYSDLTIFNCFFSGNLNPLTQYELDNLVHVISIERYQ